MDSTYFLNMIGFSVYAFEGIGVILPVMDTCACPEKYPKILLLVLVVLTSTYIFFGQYCYTVYGNELTTPIVTENLPKGDIFVNVVKVLFCFNLIFTYPLVIYPTNMVVESYLFSGMTKKSPLRQWLKNLSRTVIVGITVVMSISLAAKLD